MSTKAKRVLSLVLIVFLLCFNSQIVYAVTDETVLYNFEYPVYPGMSDLELPELKDSAGPNVDALEVTVNIDTFREHLIKYFASCPSFVDVTDFKIPYTADNWNALKSYIWYETPELFQIKGLGYSTSGGYFSGIYASYYYTADQYSTMYKEFEAGADKLLEGVKGNENLSDVEKALLLHDRIVVWCEYTQGAKPRESYNAYGVFVKQNAVCMGYTLAYDYLLRQVGIDSYYCSSDSLNHAWNIVYIDGIKYHVDVTWDDPTYDRSGRVRHVNFLRSTDGIISTKHGTSLTTIDYDSTPTDTTYDSYYWQNSNTAFQLVNDEIYYIDNSAKTLNKITDGVTTTCKNVSDIWWASPNSYWSSNYSTLSYDGKHLLYNLSSAVYKYDVETGVSTIIYEPDLTKGDYYYIYGFKYENCKLICEVFNTPNFESTTKAENTQTQDYHVSFRWITDNVGIKCKQCINCDCIIELDTSSVEIVVPVNETVVNNDEYVIFTDTFCCDNIANLITVNSAFNFTVNANNETSYGTGVSITISYQDFEVSEYTLIVNGDLNGDSVCDVLDASEAEKYATEKKEPSLTEIYAANANVSDTIDAQSYQNVVNIALNA